MRNKDRVVKLDGQEISKSNFFQYLVSIVYTDGEIEDDVNNRMQTKWMK